MNYTMETDSPKQERRFVKKKRLQGYAECIADLRQMVNNSTFSDIVFVCNDGKQVQALRKLVAGRSEVLKSMLLNGMAETTQSQIELPETSSRVLLSVLEFLYTGILLDYPPESWTMGCELILASRFFILPTLENIIREFMHEQIFSVAEDKTKAASLLTEALTYGLCPGLCGEKDGFLVELVRILSSGWSNSHFVKSLSEDALHYMLANSKGYREDDGTLTLREYNRFMLIILWFFYKSNLGSHAKEKLVNFIPEAEIKASSLLKDRDNVERGASPCKHASSLFNHGALCLLHHVSKTSLMRLLSNIDFRRIHPILLSKVVEPLSLIPAAEILKSFRFHALHRDIFYDVGLEFVWDHAKNCRPLGRGGRIQKAASKSGLAIMKKALADGTDSCCFEIEDVSEDFVELGLFSYSSEVGNDRPEFDGKRVSEQDHALVVIFQRTQVFVKLERPLGRVKWKLLQTYSSMNEVKGNIITLSYDGSQHNCSLSFGKSTLLDFGVIWKDIPRRLYYPAVSFGDSSIGQVSVKFL